MTKKIVKTAAPNALIIKRAKSYAGKVARKDFGPCTVVRAVTQKYPSLRRRDVLAIAEALKIDQGTARQQFFLTRSGNIAIQLPL